MQVSQMVSQKQPERKLQAKRVDIVTLKMVRNPVSSISNGMSNPEDVYNLVKKFLSNADRKHFLVVCLDTKNQPTASMFAMWGVSIPASFTQGWS